MPRTRVIFFKDQIGDAPVVEWLKGLRVSNPKAWAHCSVRIEMLAEFGHELRRPSADFLRDGIYELRAKQGRVHYRILYFFHGRNVAVLSHAMTKEGAVPSAEIERALKRRILFLSNPKEFTHEQEAD